LPACARPASSNTASNTYLSDLAALTVRFRRPQQFYARLPDLLTGR
jgi:hypothetical protein